jgi:hypothetical protein
LCSPVGPDHQFAEIGIRRDNDEPIRIGIRQDHIIGGSQQAYVGDMNGLESLTVQLGGNTGRQVRVDQESHGSSLSRHGERQFALLDCGSSELKGSQNVGPFQVWVIVKNIFDAAARGKLP